MSSLSLEGEYPPNPTKPQYAITSVVFECMQLFTAPGYGVYECAAAAGAAAPSAKATTAAGSSHMLLFNPAGCQQRHPGGWWLPSPVWGNAHQQHRSKLACSHSGRRSRSRSGSGQNAEFTWHRRRECRGLHSLGTVGVKASGDAGVTRQGQPAAAAGPHQKPNCRQVAMYDAILTRNACMLTQCMLSCCQAQ